MLKILAIVAIVVVVLLVALVGLAATRPDAFRYQRTSRVQAPPEKIFGRINDFRNWGSWSPYEKLDPAMKRTYSGAESGKGAVYAWDSQGKAGTGRMEILESTSPSKVVIKLDFSKPFEAHNTAEFALESRGDTTDVTWAMHGRSPFMAKVMGLFLDMDNLVGKDFETGLANLKALAEK